MRKARTRRDQYSPRFWDQDVLKIFFRIYLMLLARRTLLMQHYGLHRNEFDSRE